MEIKEKDIQRFEEIIGELDELMQKIRAYNPDASIYVPMTAICLMKGETHDKYEKPLQDNAVVNIDLGYIGGGDW